MSSTLLILLAMPALYYAAVEIGFVLRAFYDWTSSVVLWGSSLSKLPAKRPRLSRAP